MLSPTQVIKSCRCWSVVISGTLGRSVDIDDIAQTDRMMRGLKRWIVYIALGPGVEKNPRRLAELIKAEIREKYPE